MATLVFILMMVIACIGLCLCLLGVVWCVDAFVVEPLNERRRQQIALLRALAAEPVEGVVVEFKRPVKS